MTDVTTNLSQLKVLIADFEKKYHRAQHSVTLLAVSKGQPLEKIQAAFAAGQRSFGESYLQEALPKIAAFNEGSVEWHFIGPVQSNKTHKIAQHFAWVHSIASKKIAKRLNDQRPPDLPPLNLCIEINIDHEATKSGINLDEVVPLAKYCIELPNIQLRGLMAIPATRATVMEQREAFHALFLAWQSLREQGFVLDTLSMGMSEDFEAAIAEGSTIIRIGRSIFGERHYL